MTCSSSSITDYIVASFLDRVALQEILNVELSDHQPIYYTRKITRMKRVGHKQIEFCSFKHYTVDSYERALGKINFPNYENFNNINNAYSNFIQKLMEVIDKVVSIKIKRIKRKWFHRKISEV